MVFLKDFFGCEISLPTNEPGIYTGHQIDGFGIFWQKDENKVHLYQREMLNHLYR